MPAEIRKRKAGYIAESLKGGRGFEGDQGAVWRDVGEMNEKAGAKSVSGAMKDGFEAKRHTIEEYRTAFKKMRRQKGVLVAIGGPVQPLGGAVVATPPLDQQGQHDQHQRDLARRPGDPTAETLIGEQIGVPRQPE